MSEYDDIKETLNKLKKLALKYKIPIITSLQKTNHDPEFHLNQVRKTFNPKNPLIIDYVDIFKSNNKERNKNYHESK